VLDYAEKLAHGKRDHLRRVRASRRHYALCRLQHMLERERLWCGRTGVPMMHPPKLSEATLSLSSNPEDTHRPNLRSVLRRVQMSAIRKVALSIFAITRSIGETLFKRETVMFLFIPFSTNFYLFINVYFTNSSFVKIYHLQYLYLNQVSLFF